MKFLGATIAYIAIGAVLGVGIWMGVAKHSYWLLAASVVTYVIAFAKIGCLPSGDSHH
jgi:hypothetical protein